MPPAEHIRIAEDVAGVFIASCTRCQHVVGVRSKRRDVERDAGFHCCEELETLATPSPDRHSFFVTGLLTGFFIH